MSLPTLVAEHAAEATLCAQVDYWKARALRAETALQEERENRIKEHPELWAHYQETSKCLGLIP